MKHSPNCYAVAKSFEAFEPEAYPDPRSDLGEACTRRGLRMSQYRQISNWQALKGAPWTIGYGHTGGVKPGDTITEDQAHALMVQDFTKCDEEIEKYVNVDLNQGQHDCLADMVFNMGPKFLKSSGLADALAVRDFDTVRRKIPQYRLSGGKVFKGLVRRRAADLALWDGKTGEEAAKIGWAAA